MQILLILLVYQRTYTHFHRTVYVMNFRIKLLPQNPCLLVAFLSDKDFLSQSF